MAHVAASLAGRVGLITGAASGIGAATARKFVAAGASVALVDRDAGGLEKIAAELDDHCVRIEADVAAEEQCQGAVEAVVSALGRLDIVINSAGIGAGGSVLDISVQDWDRLYAVDVRGVFLMTKYAAREMVTKGRGVIINIGSVMGTQVAELASPYCSAKAAVAMFTECAARELGPRGIRLVCIAPGYTDTPINNFPAAMRQALEDNIPLGRAAKADEIAAVITFVAGDDAAWITGTSILVDGGQHTREFPSMKRGSDSGAN
jgi:NAD(P)-dependent dehydrogenase (short-subunit alcohol dehydrogenase family)